MPWSANVTRPIPGRHERTPFRLQLARRQCIRGLDPRRSKEAVEANIPTTPRVPLTKIVGVQSEHGDTRSMDSPKLGSRPAPRQKNLTAHVKSPEDHYRDIRATRLTSRGSSDRWWERVQVIQSARMRRIPSLNMARCPRLNRKGHGALTRDTESAPGETEVSSLNGGQGVLD
jgi:hypothetical protein